MAPSRFIYIGIRGAVVALNPANGEELWSTALKGSGFVNVVLDDGNLYATTGGEVFCLEPKTGTIRWNNPLRGYGLGLATIAGAGIAQSFSTFVEEKRRRDEHA